MLDTVCAYFKRGSARKAVWKVDPQLATFGLLGAVSVHHLLRDAFTSREGTQDAAADRPEHYVSLWLHGLKPHPQLTMDPCNDAVSASI